MKSDFDSYKGLSEGSGDTRGELIRVRAENDGLRQEMEDTKEKLKAMKVLEDKVEKLTREKAEWEKRPDAGNYESQVAYLQGLVAAYENEEVRQRA